MYSFHSFSRYRLVASLVLSVHLPTSTLPYYFGTTPDIMFYAQIFHISKIYGCLQKITITIPENLRVP